MLPSSSSLSQRLGLHELKAVLKEQTSPAQTAPEKAGQDILRQLHDRMAQGEGWQEDEAFCQTLDGLLRHDEFRKAFEKDTGQALPEGAKHLDKTQSAKLISFISARVVPAASTPASPEASAEQDFSVSARQSLQNVMKGCLQQMALDILLETGLKLTGMDKSMTETFVPVIKLIQEARAALLAGDENLADRIKGLTEALNTARNSLKHISSDSVVFRGTDILCDVADVLHKGLASSDLSDLKAPVEKLGTIPGLAPVIKSVMPLLELGGLLQQWNNNSITGQELVRSLADRVMPEQLSLLLKTGEKIARGVHSGKLHVEGLPAWPGMTDKMACLQWLKTALTNDSLHGTLAAADSQWLTATLGLDAGEARYVHTNLLQYAQPLARFPAQGTPGEWLMALKTMPGLSEILTRADLSLNDNLGAAGPLLKDNTTLSRLGGVATASGTTGKAWEVLKLVDTGKSLTALKNITIEGLKKTFGVATDTASAVWLVLRKGNAFRQSAYSPGQSLSDPVRLYRDVISFIKEDVKNNPDDYKNATVETLLATVAVVLKSFGGNHVPVNWGGNTAEWLEAYAKADPKKLTAVDNVLMHAVLEPRAVLEIKQAIQQEDPVQARKLLEPLSNALKSYAGDSPVLRQMAGTLPYIPAITEAWNEIRAMDLSERKALGSELRQQAVLLNDILRNSRSNVSPETLASRQKAVLALQEKLVVLQDKCGAGTGRVGVLQAELDAMKIAVKTQPDETRIRLTEELDLAQSGLDNLKDPDTLKGMPENVVAQVYARQASLHKNVRETLVGEGVSPATIMQAQLKDMAHTLDALPIEINLTDMGSLLHFATEALTRLATSTKPNLVSVRTELATLVRNAASDGLADVVRWAGNQIMKPFTKEVELTPEEKEMGVFVIEENWSAGQLATGAAAGAASGALLSAMFLLLSGEGVPGLRGGREQPGKMTMHRTTPEGVTGPGGVNTESGPQTVRLTLSHAGVYTPTTEPLNQESNTLKKWLMLALPVVAGAAAGAGIAAAREPAVREKYPEGMTAVNDPARTPMSGENLYTYKDGVTKGIYLTNRAVDAARVSPESPQELSKEGASSDRSKRSLFSVLFSTIGRTTTKPPKVTQLQKQNAAKEQLLRQQLASGKGWTNASDHYSTPEQRNSPDHKPEVVKVDLSNLPTQVQRREPVNQEPDHYYFYGSPERDINFPRFNFKFDTTANNTLNEYLRYVFQQYGNGLSYAEVLPNDIYVKYSTGGTGMFVTPQQLVSNQVDSLLKELNGSVLSIVNMAASAKEYTFSDRYPAPLQDKLKGGGFWQDVKATMKAQLADTEVVSGYKSKIRKNAELTIRLNAKGDITQEKVDRKMNRCQPVQYKGRTVAGMFIVPGKNDKSKGRLYSLNPQFKAADIVFNKDISHLLDTALEKEIALGFTGSSQEKSELFISGNKLNPNGIPKFHAWGGTRKNVEDFLFDITTKKLHDDLDAITVSDGEQALMNALEITKWGMAVISAPLGPKGAAVAALISSLASTLQAQIVENPADSERYMQEALWELAFAGIGHAASDLLGNVPKNVLRNISNKIDETIDAIKARPTSLKQRLDEFHYFVDIKRVSPLNDKLKVAGVDLSDIPAETTGINSGTYKKGDNYYIKQGDNIFEVFLDKDNNTLRLRNPGQRRNGGYHPPVRLNTETNSWGTHSEVGLQGGGKTWGNARPSQGMANKMKPDYNTIGQPTMGQAPSIQRPEIKNGQWANSKGTLSTLDDNLKVMGIDLSGVQVERTGTFRGTYKKGENYYIQQDSTTFEVFLDQNNNTLRLKNPGQPRSGGDHPPVRLNTETNSWEMGLQNNARPPQGLASEIKPNDNTSGLSTMDQAPAIQRPEIKNGQWANSKGTHPTLDDNLKVMGIDLSGVQVERTGTFRGTYKKGENYYIQQDSTTFEVFLDQNNNTLRLKNPDQPRSGGNHPPVRFNENTGSWEA